MAIKLRLKHSATANKAPLPGDLVEGERSRRQQAGASFDQGHYANAPKVSVGAKYWVPRDNDGDRVGAPQVKATSYDIPYLAAHAIQAVRDAVSDNPIRPGQAVETNEQLVDVANFVAVLLPPAPPAQFV